MSVAELASPDDLSAPSPGARLAAARESRGLSVAEVAQQLKLSPRQVEALESNDYGRLPGVVFVRGFIRNYARLLHLDATLLLARIEHEPPPVVSVGPEIRPSSDIPFPVVRSFGWKKYAVGAGILLVALTIFEFYRNDPEDDTIKVRQAELPAPQAVAATAPVADEQSNAAPSNPAPAQAAPEAGARQRPGNSVRANATESRPAQGERVLRLRFTRESWVEIRDRSGRKIFSQMNLPGTEQVVSGLPPLSLVVGNANGVQLIHNEQPVSLGPYIKIDVARLTLE